MNYIDLLKQRNKTLIINGSEGSGKSLLSAQLVYDCVNTVIKSDELYSDFTNWLADTPEVVTIDVDERDVQLVMAKIKQFTSSDDIQINIKYKESRLMKTPFFILNVNVDDTSYFNDRRCVLIELGNSHD